MKPEMKGWPKNDGNIDSLYRIGINVPIFDHERRRFQVATIGVAHYIEAGSFPISQFFAPFFDGIVNTTLIIIERSAWWLHIVGILFFLNYLYFSKHLHILLAFPNTYYGKLKPKG